LKRELGKYLLDVSKLIFGGAVIAGIMKENIGLAYVLPAGIFSALGIAYLGFTFIKPSKTK
jgi:hypothetical protein